jgi:hypothetical protein
MISRRWGVNNFSRYGPLAASPAEALWREGEASYVEAGLARHGVVTAPPPNLIGLCSVVKGELAGLQARRLYQSDAIRHAAPPHPLRRQAYLHSCHVQPAHVAWREMRHPQQVLIGEAEADIDDIMIRPYPRCLGDQRGQGSAGIVDGPRGLPLAEVEVTPVRGAYAGGQQAIELGRGQALEGRVGPSRITGGIPKAWQRARDSSGKVMHGRRLSATFNKMGVKTGMVTRGRLWVRTPTIRSKVKPRGCAGATTMMRLQQLR